jgi:tetratricopeptide (TPR) repeat protein
MTRETSLCLQQFSPDGRISVTAMPVPRRPIVQAFSILLLVAVAPGAERHRTKTEDPFTYFQRASEYLNKGQASDAIVQSSHAISLDPEYAEAYYVRRAARFLKKDYVNAIVDLSEAIGLDPNLSEAYRIRGLVRSKRGDFAKAVADFSRD